MAHNDSLLPWAMRVDSDGAVYWYRRDGLTEAVVREVRLEGYEPWQYVVGVGEYTSTDYAPSIRSAKVRATKLVKWFKAREAFYAALQPKLRFLLERGRDKEDMPDTSDPITEQPDRIQEAGILWQWDHAQCKWVSGQWVLSWDQVHGWILRYPKGERQVLRSRTRSDAMKEAAFWIGRHARI